MIMKLKVINKVCLSCGKKFIGKENRKYCSTRCWAMQYKFKKGFIPWNKGKIGVMPIAWNKGKKGKMSWHNTKGLNSTGGIFWNKGKKYAKISEKREDDYRMRRLFRVQIQKKVFERDNYTCQLCGAKGNLQVDHIQSWADYVELRFCIDNCRTLCAKCHYKITFGKEMPKTTKTWGHNLLERSEFL